MRTLLIILLLATSAIAQYKAPKGLTATYDRFKDVTEVGFYDVGLVGPTFTAWVQFAGKEPVEPIEAVHFTFSDTKCHGFCFKGNTELIFILDAGERLTLGPLDVLSDSVTFTVDRDTLTKITSAKKVDFRVGVHEGGWRDKNLNKLRAFLDIGK